MGIHGEEIPLRAGQACNMRAAFPSRKVIATDKDKDKDKELEMRCEDTL